MMYPYAILMKSLEAVFRIRIRIIWPDPFQTIRIRVAPKTYQNHEKKIVLK